ncbi:hypothetical protein A5789_27780 [Nocardia sp. 852002-51101_SCH5132738]|uniref:hypothetical protein n=1 Tax=Nocardia sp. 852002-51101_SCH5132738 TaxID=1834095 RepID=UPI0007EBE7CB|nr:hypothetical protein [Nocardia sp. 852002-51101_SCH5132738]OBA51490.1 hypothetical protein A5789_27780 [Nocardia sp. 852002-51101_SCH5132738]
MSQPTIPDAIESALADFALAVRENAGGPTPATEKARRESLNVLRAMIASELSDAREDGARTAMGYAPIA